MDDFKRPEQNDVPNGDPVSTEPVAYEDSETYVTPQGEPTVATPTPAPLESVKKKSHAGRWLLWGLVVLLLAGLGAFAYWQYTEAENQKAETDSLKSALATAQEANKSATDDTTAVVDKTEQSDDTTAQVNRITAVVTADAQAPVASKGAKLDVRVVKQSDEFAYANAGSPEGAGYAVILKKVNDEWVIVFKGQNTPDKTTVDKYGIPAEYQSGQ